MEDEEECCEELLGECDDDDIDDLVQSDELSWAVDGDDGMSERARNPFIDYEADVDDQEGEDSTRSMEDARVIRESRVRNYVRKSVGGLIPSCGPCRLYSPGITAPCMVRCVVLVRCMCGRGCTTRRTSFTVRERCVIVSRTIITASTRGCIISRTIVSLRRCTWV